MSNTSLPKIFGTFVQIEDCAPLCIQMSEHEKTVPLVASLREEAFRYGEHMFDQCLLERVIEPCLPDEESF